MLVRTVAGIDHRAVELARQQLDRAGSVMAHHQDVGCMALSVIAVSISVSPLRIEEEEADMFITSAPSRLPANSNEACVRVETSKNKLIWVRPRKIGRFFS